MHGNQSDYFPVTWPVFRCVIAQMTRTGHEPNLGPPIAPLRRGDGVLPPRDVSRRHGTRDGEMARTAGCSHRGDRAEIVTGRRDGVTGCRSVRFCHAFGPGTRREQLVEETVGDSEDALDGSRPTLSERRSREVVRSEGEPSSGLDTGVTIR